MHVCMYVCMYLSITYLSICMCVCLSVYVCVNGLDTILYPAVIAHIPMCPGPEAVLL